jgi:hypothetical protein
VKTEPRQIAAAEKRYPELFALIDSVVDYFSTVVDEGKWATPKCNLDFVRLSAVIRAYNILKSIRQLLATDHWENAAILMRSLFELMLNIEELEREPAQAERQAERFIRFETLQRYRRIKAETDYAIATGRKTAKDPELVVIENSLPTFFSEWAEKRKDGTIRWRTNWSGKTVRQLCEAGASTVRIGQYEIVYAFGSDMAHSSPSSVLSAYHGNAQDWDTFFAKADQSERNATLTVVTLSVTFACEIVGITKFLGGAFDPIKMLKLTRNIYLLYGVQPPALHPVVEKAMRDSKD